MTSIVKQRIEQIQRGEVPQGYKKAKFGVVPSEWEITKLSSISSHVTKKNTDGNIQTTFTNSATQGVIKQTDYFDKEISNRENITGYYVVQENDYIYNPRISASAPCGPINKSHFVDEGVVSPLYTVFKMTNDLQKNQYIEYYLKSPFWHRYMCGVANYGARHDRMNITNDDLFAMPVPLPPLAEQKKIAEILSAQDKLIALKEKLIEEKKRQKKALMQQLLMGKKNISGSSSKEWKLEKLGTICNIRTGKLDANAMVKDGLYPFYTCAEEVYKIDNYAFDTEALIISGNGANVGYINYYNGKFNAYQRTYVLDKFNANIFYVKFVLDLFLHIRIQKEKNAGNTPYIKLSVLSDMTLRLPSIKEQIEISKIIISAEKEVELLQKDLDQEKQKKKALMQLLLTGIVRV